LKKIKDLKDESNGLEIENEKEDDDEEDDEEDDEKEEEMEEEEEDDNNDDDDMNDITSQNPIVLNFEAVLKKIHEIMKIHSCNIHLEHIDVNMSHLYVTFLFL